MILIMKTNQDFHLVDKTISQMIMAEQETWTEECQTCKGTGQMPSLPKNEIIIQCVNCLGEGEVEYER